LNKPETGIPERKGDHGRISTKEWVLEGEPDPIEARKLKDQLGDSEWNHIFVPAAMLTHLETPNGRSYGRISENL